MTSHSSSILAQRRLAAIVQFADDAIIGIAESGEIESWNHAAEGLYGYRADEMLGQCFLEVTAPATQSDLRRLLQSVARGDRVQHYQTTHRHRDGSDIEVSLTLSPIFDDDGRLCGASAIVKDDTSRRKEEKRVHAFSTELESRVRQRTRELEVANQELEAFTYSVSHDLRAPLRAIDGFSRIILEDYGPQLDAEGQRLLNIVRSETQQMGKLIDDLLRFSRTGRQALRLQEIDCETLVQQVYDEIPAEEKQHVVAFEIGPLPPAIADSALLRQVFANLLGNAVKFTSQNAAARIEVGALAEEEAITYFVKDNGVGFDKRYLHKLFGVFQRLHAEEEFAGTGVGLALVQRIIHRHRGQVWAEGELGQGASFFFSLPNTKATEE